MAVFIARRLLASIPLLVLATLLVFVTLELVPGDPAELLAGEDATPQRVAEIRHELGLDRPLLVRYGDWLAGLLRGDLGTSLSRGMPVRDLVRGALGPTVELAVAASAVGMAAGIGLGTLQAAAGGRLDGWISAAVSLAISVPGFVVATVLLWVFAIQLDWLPASGRVPVLSDPLGGLRTLALPAVLQQEYIRAARARGLPERTILVRHSLRPALVPVLTVAALQVGNLLTGALVVEQVFTRPGIGYLAVTAVRQRDIPLVQGVVVVFALAYVLVNLAADLAVAFADPRLRQ
jgi:peptide/nickel transport system permease protein